MGLRHWHPWERSRVQLRSRARDVLRAAGIALEALQLGCSLLQSREQILCECVGIRRKSIRQDGASLISRAKGQLSEIDVNVLHGYTQEARACGLRSHRSIGSERNARARNHWCDRAIDQAGHSNRSGKALDGRV